MKYKKTFWTLVLLLVGGIGLFTQQLNEVLHRASYSTTSPSGRYLLQHVSAGSLLVPFDPLGYLQVTDLKDPQRVYRTPLIQDWSLDLRMWEHGDTLSIFGLEFNTATKTYLIQWDDWRPHWLNGFISNTPYRLCTVAERNCY